MEIKAVKFRKDGFYTQPFVLAERKDPKNLPKTSAIAAACRII